MSDTNVVILSGNLTRSPSCDTPRAVLPCPISDWPAIASTAKATTRRTRCVSSMSPFSAPLRKP